MPSRYPGHASLGRRVTKDANDAKYPMRALIQPRIVETAPLVKTWSLRIVDQLDQHQTPECVTYAGEHWKRSTPIRCRTGPSPDDVYRRCKAIDGAPNDDGTDSRALMKVYQSLGMVGEYHWAQHVSDITDYLLTRGPVLLGVLWLDKMFEPRADGYLDLGGSVAGGHEILAIGYNAKIKRATIVNSWWSKGESDPWGINGRAYLHLDDLTHLFTNDGDACAAVEVREPRRAA